MTPQEAALELLRRRRGRASLAGYANAIEIPGKPATDDPDEWLFKPVESGLAAHHLLLLQAIERAASRRYGRLMVFMPPGSAKALALDTPIPTPTGWTTMGELRVGDEVFDENGAPCRVTGKSQVWRDRPTYIVRTDCGDEIIADQEHEWRVRLCGKPRAALKANGKGRPPLADRDDPASQFKIKETREIARGRAKRAMVERAKALQLPPADLPIDPYLLGVWLGDGNSADLRITSSVDDQPWLRAELERLGIKTFSTSVPTLFSVHGMRAKFMGLGLIRAAYHGILGRKHIPAAYLRGSIEQRLALLQGLVDTDGTVCKRRGCTTFCNTNLELAEGVRELVRSLGVKAGWSEGRAMLYGKDCGPVYRVSFFMAGSARMPRKAELTRDQYRTPNTYIEAELTESVDTVCIEVDSTSHLFLAGRSMTPTHNSTFASVVAPTYIMGKNPGTKIILASYGSDLARKHGRKARQIVRSSGFSSLFGATISKDSSAANEWALTNGSEYMAAGLLAGLTGNRANCLSGGTMVATDDGESRIDSLVESGDPGYVLSYDINSQRLVHRRIKAVARSEAEGLYRVRTANGGVVDCTGDHRFYTQRGFVEARLLSSDDRLLRLVQAEPEEECLPDEEGGQEGAGRGLLRPRMPAAGGECSSREAGRQVQGVRHQASAVRAGGAERVAILRGCVQRVCREGEKGLDDAEEAGAAVRDVQHQLQAEDHECAGSVLRQGMQGPRAFGADDAGEESGLAQWRESGASGRAQRKELQGCEAEHHQAGRRGVRRVRGNEDAARPSHRHELHEQRMAESGDVVRRVPHAASWGGSLDTTGDPVAMVERLCGPAMVYDIQVDGTECFFANGLLVHNCAIIDDPIKGREQADSPTIRGKTWDAYTDDLQTRLIPGGSLVLVSTRWHEDDLSGRLLPKNYAGESGMVECRDGRMWEIINLPAECERADDPLGRKVGEMLWPEWFDASHWAPFRKQSRTWASLFQQRPRPDEGGIFKDGWCVRRWGTIPREADLCVHSWDTAQKPDQLNDPSVGTMWRMGGNAPGYYLADLYRERVDYPTLRRKVMAYAERDRPAAVLIEDKSSGQSLIQELRTTTTLPVIAIEPHGSKLFRANEVSSMVESGLLILPESAPWLADFEGEFFGFPLTTHDDQVDSVTQFLKWVRGWSRSVESYGAGMTRTLASQMTDDDLEEAAGGWGSVGRGTDMDGFN